MGTIRQTIRARPRLFLSILAGAASVVLIPAPGDPVARALIGWNVTVWCYLALVCWLMVRSGHERVRRLAEQEDRGAGIILAIMSTAALVSLAAIILELSTIRNLTLGHRLANYAFTGATVFGSWFLVATLFTLHYARAYYRSPAERRALGFPDGETNPDYWDFLYFSFTIAVAAQTSDVSVISRPLRRIVLAQSVLSFFFNLAILGLTVNVAASLVEA